MNEQELVARVRELFSERIGDDAAVVGDQVITTDMLVEDVDFTRAIPLRFIGRKSLAVNLSDIAAMGARPAHAVVAIGLPDWAREHVDDLLVAMSEAAKQWRVEIVGGDFSRSDKLVISVAMVGVMETRALLRSGAKVGDRIYVSRPIGGSAAGLALLQQGFSVEAGFSPPFPSGGLKPASTQKRAILVTHGTAIRVAVTVLLGLPLSASRNFAQDNAAINVFNRRGDHWVLKSWNDHDPRTD
jgi:thiamin-phosphate kinase